MSKERKQRGILATPTGKQKLQEAKANGRNELGKLLTYDNIAEKAVVDKKTVERFMRRLQLIDRDNALAICQALGLEITDVVDPDEWNYDESSNTEINWTEICQQALINKPLRRFATDEPCELEIFVPLGLVERKKQQRRPLNQEMERNQVYEVEEKEEITRRFEHEEFLNYIGLGTTQGESDKNIAIIGEPGAGKTTLLQNLALIISDQQKGLPICVSLGALSKERSLIGYLEETWLRDGLAVGEVKESDKADFRQLFDKGQVWLILDGLDEYSADSPVEALTWIENEVRSSYLQKARVVVSCRVNVWDAHLTNPLQGFIPYKTLDFTEYQRNQFIKEWFEYKHNSDLGKSLINRLQDSGRESLRELVKNPLRLVVLCQIWSLGRGDLPETKAKLYQVYLPYFYDWKKEVRDLTQDDHLQASLHQALGKLAIAGIESVSRYRLPRKLAVEVMGQELFKLAVTLGWLNIVDRDIVTQEAVYAFFHPNFQEFFAACGVEDWDFFLPRNHVDHPVKGKVYRIFEAKWKEVILLWLGRGDVKDEEKEGFIRDLVDFKDGCEGWGFYYNRAYYLARLGIIELKTCSLGNQIVAFIISLAFGFWDWETKEWKTYFDPVSKSARAILTETDRPKAIALLNGLIYSSKKEYELNYAAKSLGEIGEDSQLAISALRYLIHSSQDEYTLINAVKSLQKIGQNDETVISALRYLIHSSKDEFILTEAVKSLQKIEQNDETAILALINLLRSSKDEYTLQEAANSLGAIGQGNETAILALINLLRSSNDTWTIHHALWSLEKIGQGNETAISALTDMIRSSRDPELISSIVQGLVNIAQGNKTVVSTLIDIIHSSQDKQLISSIVQGLGNIAQDNETVILALNNLIHSLEDDFTILLIRFSLWEISPNKETALDFIHYICSLKEEYIFVAVAAGLKEMVKDDKTIILACSDLISSSQDKSIIRRASRVLGEIDSTNTMAISTLINLILPLKDESNLPKTATNSGEIRQDNKIAILALIDLIHLAKDQSILREVAKLLEENDSSDETAILALIDIIRSSKDESVLQNIAISLGEIRQIREIAISALVDLLHLLKDDWIQDMLIGILGEIGQGNETAILFFIDLLGSSSDDKTRQQAASSLGQIGQGNETAILALIDLLRSSSDEKTVRDTIWSLEKIGQGNETAILALIDLLRSSSNKNIKSTVSNALEKIGKGNEKAILALIDLLHSSSDETTFSLTILTLQKIGQDNETAILALINLLYSSSDETILYQATKSIEKMLQQEQMPKVVTTLKYYLLKNNYESCFKRYSYQILWKCAQTLSYPEFYQAWHASTNPETTPIGDTPTSQQLNLQHLPDLLPSEYLYLNPETLNHYNTSELSQELCNLIYHRLQQYPIPEANNIPQLKRHLIPLIAQNTQLTLIFGESDPSDTLLSLCQQLNPTIPIAWITENPIANLQTFSPNQPNLIEVILNWKNR
ncbi:HEAT repeat domain-containing protein [Microcystis aeruginosa]|uniref:HEAT repeat domain-containing protein n=1 Tax=Microcystis aeruginosa TaxID=1126 RepID=UPI000932C802|nr:HEAT repeat domain-containing protein [Microcystis aeruginosa]